MLAPRRLPAVAALAVLAAVATACGGSTPRPARSPHATPSPSATSAAPTPTAGRTAAAVPPGGWLTGKPGPTGPVVAVKIDNAASARPLQHGLGAAELVYQELVEGGVSRFMALYVGSGTTDIGPVRSARDTDIELLAQYGPVVFGFSGANRGVLSHIDASPLLAVPQERFAGAYEMRGRRPEAYNFYTTPQQLIHVAPKPGADLHDVGFRFGPAPAGGRPVSGGLTARFSAYNADTISWDAARGGWHLSQAGRAVAATDGSPVAPANVLVQYVDLTKGGYVDVLGNNSPDSATVGQGGAVLLRDGQRFDGHWSRPKASAPTTWSAADGSPLRLHPGQTFVLLVPKGNPLQ